ncbi:MAG TPA: glycosyltransferase family 4 protein [Flavisolibacter sp.]|nr:glycosyltransferase family 4 protein [Flavisolibacter sp.]
MSKTKAHIAILASRLDLPGGTERMVVEAANLFTSKGHDVTLLLPEKSGPSFFRLDKSVRIIIEPLDFGLTESGNMVTRKTRLALHVIRLRRALRKINQSIVLSTDYVYTICAGLAAYKGGPKIFAWEHHHFFWLNKSRFWKWLQRVTYPRLNGVVCLNHTEAKLYQQTGCKTFVIPNFIRAQEAAALETPTLLTIGWLIDRKGIDLVPKIAKGIFADSTDWKWIVIGSGDREEQLREAVRDLQLEERVSVLPPLTPDLSEAYLNTSIYVMTSRFECFPMVLLEAMSHGIPSVAFNCPTGPSEIIADNEDGFLIEKENVGAMIDAIKMLMKDPLKRKKMGAAAFRHAHRFSPERIYPLWESLFENN